MPQDPDPFTGIIRFAVKDKNGQDEATIFLSEEGAKIRTAVWPKDETGKVIDKGVAQTVEISRHELIGLAYEILNSVK